MERLASSTRLTALVNRLRPLKEQVVAHPLYARIQRAEDLRKFMESHCFVVWDFMSLLKSLQREMTCLTVPWFPQGDPVSRRLINEIVMGEESDENGEGGFLSHFELYLQAMRQCGANPARLLTFLEYLKSGQTVPQALESTEVPQGPRDFVRTTWSFVESGSLPAVAGAFTLGREDLVPEMFHRLVEQLHARAPEQWGIFLRYLERHIRLDDEVHRPLAFRLLARVCGEDEGRWDAAESAARRALEARLRLWNGILGTL